MAGAAVFVSKRLTEHILDTINSVDINNIGDTAIYDELKPFFERIDNENKQKSEMEALHHTHWP